MVAGIIADLDLMASLRAERVGDVVSMTQGEAIIRIVEVITKKLPNLPSQSVAELSLELLKVAQEGIDATPESVTP